MGHRQTSPEQARTEFESMFSLSYANCVPASLEIMNIASLFNEWTMFRCVSETDWVGPATEQPLHKVQQERALAAMSATSFPTWGPSHMTVSAFNAATAACRNAVGGCTALGGSVRLVGDGNAVTGSSVDEESKDSHDTVWETTGGDLISEYEGSRPLCLRGDVISEYNDSPSLCFEYNDSPSLCLHAVMLETIASACGKVAGRCIVIDPPRGAIGGAACNPPFKLSSGAEVIGTMERMGTGQLARRRGGAVACTSLRSKAHLDGVNAKDRAEPTFIAAIRVFTAGDWANCCTVACKSGAVGLKVDAVVAEGTKDCRTDIGTDVDTMFA